MEPQRHGVTDDETTVRVNGIRSVKTHPDPGSGRTTRDNHRQLIWRPAKIETHVQSGPRRSSTPGFQGLLPPSGIGQTSVSCKVVVEGFFHQGPH